MTHPFIPSANVMPVAYPHPIPLPAGAGCLVVSVNRGPYLVPVTATAKLKIDGREVSISGAGTWYIPVPAGPHEVRYTDLLGIPMVTTSVIVQPGTACQLSFQFGAWRNRVYDGHGTDVTKFGMWSNYTILLITLVGVAVICCGGIGVISTLGS
jgi:hypothetical protein